MDFKGSRPPICPHVVLINATCTTQHSRLQPHCNTNSPPNLREAVLSASIVPGEVVPQQFGLVSQSKQGFDEWKWRCAVTWSLLLAPVSVFTAVSWLLPPLKSLQALTHSWTISGGRELRWKPETYVCKDERQKSTKTNTFWTSLPWWADHVKSDRSARVSAGLFTLIGRNTNAGNWLCIVSQTSRWKAWMFERDRSRLETKRIKQILIGAFASQFQQQKL